MASIGTIYTYPFNPRVMKVSMPHTCLTQQRNGDLIEDLGSSSRSFEWVYGGYCPGIHHDQDKQVTRVLT